MTSYGRLKEACKKLADQMRKRLPSGSSAEYEKVFHDICGAKRRRLDRNSGVQHAD